MHQTQLRIEDANDHQQVPLIPAGRGAKDPSFFRRLTEELKVGDQHTFTIKIGDYFETSGLKAALYEFHLETTYINCDSEWKTIHLSFPVDLSTHSPGDEGVRIE